MSFDVAVAALRAWEGEHVVVRLEPEGSVMSGVLSELDAGGVEGALFAVDREQLSGVAVALFRDGARTVAATPGELVVEQGRVTVTVTRSR